MARSSTRPPLKAVSKAVASSTAQSAKKASKARIVAPSNAPAFFQLGQGPGGLDQGCQPFTLPSGKKTRPASSVGLWPALTALCESPLTRSAALFGLLPDHFAQRSGVSVQVFSKGVESNPGRDVYLFNYSPADEALFANVLARGFLEKPDLAALAETFYGLLGEAPERVRQAVLSSEFSMAPYMVASHDFYRGWQQFLAPGLTKTNKWSAAQKALFQSGFEQTPNLEGQTVGDLLVASTLPLFLASPTGRAFKALKISLPSRESELNAHLRSLRQMRDAAVRGRAQWLLGCWLSYRNLYLLQVNGKAWCERHLRVLSAGVGGLAPVAPSALEGLDNSRKPLRSKAQGLAKSGQ